MGVLTLACILILALPDKFDYARAISFQLAEGGISAKLLFVAMHLLLLYMALRLLVWRQYLGAFTSIAMVIGLAIIAFTNPFSLLHNTAFIYLSIVTCTTLGLLSWLHSDMVLFVMTITAGIGFIVCFSQLGLGERILIASACVGMNSLYYNHLDP